MNFRKKFLLLPLLSISALRSGVMHLERFLDDQPAAHQCVEKLLILCNYRGSDLKNEDILNFFQHNIEELLESSLPKKLDLAATILAHLMSYDEIKDTFSSQSNDLALLAWSILAEPGVCCFRLDSLTEQEYLLMKDLFKTNYLAGQKPAEMKLEGFFDFISDIIFWYPPQARLNPFFKAIPSPEKSFEKISIDAKKFELGQGSVFAFNKVVQALQKYNKKELGSNKELLDSITLLWLTIDQKMWQHCLKIDTLEASFVALEPKQKVTLADAVSIIYQIVLHQELQNNLQALPDKTIFESYADLAKKIIASKYLQMFAPDIQDNFNKIADKLEFATKKYLMPSGEKMTQKEACSVLVQKNVTNIPSSQVEASFDILLQAAKQKDLKLDESLLILLELNVEKLSQLKKIYTSAEVAKIAKSFAKLLIFLKISSNKEDLKTREKCEKMLQAIGDLSGVFLETVDCSLKHTQADVTDYLRMVKNNIKSSLQSKATFIKGLLLFKEQLPVFAKASGPDALIKKNDATTVIIEAAKRILFENYKSKEAWNDIALLEALTTVILEAKKQGLVQEDLIVKKIGKSADELLVGYSWDKAKRITDLNFKKNLA